MIALVISGFGLIGCKKSAQAAELAKPNAPEGYVLVEEDVLLQFVESPGEHFHKYRAIGPGIQNETVISGLAVVGGLLRPICTGYQGIGPKWSKVGSGYPVSGCR